jgi:neopullulanase
MNYPLAEAIIGFVAGGSLNESLLRTHHEYGRVARLDGAAFADRLVSLLEAYDPDVTAVQLNLLSSHDAPRVLSILGGDRRALELAVLLQATLPGAPCTYYGDEIGLTGGIDPDNRRAFPWDETRWDGELLAWTRHAFALRGAEPLLRGAGGTGVVSTEGQAVAFERANGDGRLAIAINAGAEAIALVVARNAAPGRIAEALLANAPLTVPAVTGGGDLVIEVPARSGVVVRVP